jgi:cell division transport system permease protein
MIDKVLYLTFEGIKNIWRHKTTSLIAVISMSISIYLVCLLFIAGFNTQKVLQYFRGKYKIEVFFNQTVSNQEAVGLIHKIRKIKGVRTASIIEKEDALRIFKDQFNEDIKKILGYNPLPVSAVINLSRTKIGPINIEKLIKEIKGIGSIEKVLYQGSLIRKIEKNYKKIIDKLPYVGIAIILTTILIIFNTIRLSLYSRKELINNLRLIGATKLFIMTPFIIEGLMISFLSLMLAFPLIFGTVEGLNFLIMTFSSFKVNVGLDFKILLWLPIMVIIVSIFGSYRASSSFIK